MEIQNIILVFIMAYLLGSLPFGAIAGKMKGIDLLKFSSGSTGTTNVMRAVGFWPGIIVLILDVLKGTAASYLALIVLQLPIYVTRLLCFGWR